MASAVARVESEAGVESCRFPRVLERPDNLDFVGPSCSRLGWIFFSIFSQEPQDDWKSNRMKDDGKTGSSPRV